MEQYASSQFYKEYHDRPDEWHVERIKPGTQGSCVGLPRQYAEPPELTPLTERKFYKAGDRHDTIPHVYANNAGNWYGTYTYQKKVCHTPTKPTPIRAALAYNDAIRERELPARYLIDFGALGIDCDDQEEKSA